MISAWGTSWPASAVLLDLDGVVLDTSAGELATWRWWAVRHGRSPDEVTSAAAGRRTRDVVSELLGDDAEVETEATAIDRRRALLLRSARRPRGITTVLRSIPPTRLAVVTSATRDLAHQALRRARIRVPAVLVCAEDTDDGRPAPAPHLAAAAAVGVEAHRCLAVESTAAGIAAARAAGCTVVAVQPSRDASGLPGAAAYVPELTALRVVPSADGLEITASRDPGRLG